MADLTMNRDTVRELHALYEKREEISRAQDYADKNFWIGIISDAMSGTGIRSEVVHAAGGRGELADLLLSVVSEHLNGKVVDVDDAIRALGAKP